MHPITAVSGYWPVTNKHHNAFDHWLPRTLQINCPYVIYSREEDMDRLKQCRGEKPTVCIKRDIPEFVTYKYYNAIQTHPRHVPSKELQCIWNEKLFLLRETARLNPFESEWFIWIDAGLFLYRDQPPPEIPFCTEKLKSMPKDRLLFSSSDSPTFCPEAVQEGNYYHYVSGIFMIHKDGIERFVSMFETYVEKLLSQETWIYTDQVILTHMYKDHPEMFQWVIHDYGRLVVWLLEDSKLE